MTDTRNTDDVPDVHCAVRSDPPFHGIGGDGWLLSHHCGTTYV